MKKNRISVVLCTVICTAVTSAGLCFGINQISKKVITGIVEDSVNTVITNVQNSVAVFNYNNFATIHFAASMPIIKDNDVPLMTKSEQLFEIKNADQNIVGLNITDLKGDSYLVEGGVYNFSERDYFKNALRGKETVFGPIMNKVTNVATIFYGSPLYDDKGNLTNTLFLAVHSEYLSKICAENPLPKGGGAAIIKRSTGLVIGDANEDQVLKANLYDDSAASGIKELEDMTLSISAGESGFRIFNINGVTSVNGYAPIEGTDWSVIVKGDLGSYEKYLLSERIFMIGFSSVAVLVSLLISLFVSLIVLKKEE